MEVFVSFTPQGEMDRPRKPQCQSETSISEPHLEPT